MCGFLTAAIIRRVIGAADIASLEWTEATRRSSCESICTLWSSEPSSRMSTSMPFNRRNRPTAELISSTTPSCFERRSGERPFAIVRRGEWSVSTRYSWPRSIAVTAISWMDDPPSDQSECECRSPRSAERTASPPATRGSVARVSSDVRYSGTSPSSACRMTASVEGPMPGRSVRVPEAARDCSSVGSVASTVSAAPRKALTR